MTNLIGDEECTGFNVVSLVFEYQRLNKFVIADQKCDMLRFWLREAFFIERLPDELLLGTKDILISS